jgi:hypothetical protein
VPYYFDFKGDRGPELSCTLDSQTHGSRYSIYQTDHYGRCISCLFHPYPKQLRYFDAREPYVLIGGGRGPGKTEAICWDAIFKAHLVPKSRQIILRRTMGELMSTIVDRFRQMPPEVRGRYIGEMSYTRVELPNGSIIRFASARSDEDTRKMLSGEFLCAHFDEWSEWEYRQWKFISGSVRTTINTDIMGRPVVAQVKGATNPGGIGGDVLNHLFGGDIEKSAPIGEDPESYNAEDYLFIQSLVDDNPAYSADTSAGRAYRKMLMSQPRRVRDAWLYGKWSGFEGQYFDIFDEELTRIPHDEVVRLMHKQKWQPIWIAYDWGKTHFSYATWNTFVELRLKDGSARKFPVTYRELLINGISEVAVAAEICSMTPLEEVKRVERIYGAPETFGGDLLSRAKRMGNVFCANEPPLPRPVPAFNKREDGWTLLYTLLAEKHELDTAAWTSQCAGWLIDEELEHLWEAIPWAMSSKKPGHDGDINAEGDSPMLDVLDGARYGIASRIQPQDMAPFAERQKEILAELPVVGASRYIKGLQLAAEEKKLNQPFYTSGGHKFRGRRH